MKSSISSGGANSCVEVSLQGEFVLVRDSRDRGGNRLRFGQGAWSAFLADYRVRATRSAAR
jgi:Domain of unknown function (DUF397)